MDFRIFQKANLLTEIGILYLEKKNEGGVNINNVMVIPSDNKSNIKRIMNYTSYLVTSTLRGIFLKSPDIVVASSPPIFTALAGLIVAKLKRAKFVLDIRDIWPESAVQMGSKKCKNHKSFRVAKYYSIKIRT